jgi:aminopeptidase-like protein
MINFAKKIFPLNRSLTGKDVVKTLKFIKKEVPSLKLCSIKSGTKVFDWTVPEEWNVRNAFILDPTKKKIADFKKRNIHLMGYSLPIKKKLNLKNLKKKIYFLKKLPNAIPYVTSYYKKDWGFCLTYNQFKKLKKGTYEVKINSSLKKGKLFYGHIYLKGKSKKEILLSTNICHPSLGNNECSGITLLTYLAKWLSKLNKKYSYRIVFVPETIGALCFIKQNYDRLKKNVIGGYTVTCVGDERIFSFLPSRSGNTLSDKIALKILKANKKTYKTYKWLDRGSDERQYCSPNINLPIASVMRSKYATYKEYHTSLDDLKKVVTNKGLNQSLDIYKKIINMFENNYRPVSKNIGEPFLKKHGLFKSKTYTNDVRLISDLLSYCDGQNDLVDISNLCKKPFKKITKFVKLLRNKNLIH